MGFPWLCFQYPRIPSLFSDVRRSKPPVQPKHASQGDTSSQGLNLFESPLNSHELFVKSMPRNLISYYIPTTSLVHGREIWVAGGPPIEKMLDNTGARGTAGRELRAPDLSGIAGPHQRHGIS